MAMFRQFGRFAVLLVFAWAVLEVGCTYVPLDLDAFGCDEAVLTPFSGEFGYDIQGAAGAFAGTLVKHDVNSRAWDLEGEFNFPTRGYTVGTPEIEIVATWPEQVYITIPVWSPKAISFVCNADTRFPVNAVISAATNAEFKVLVCSRPEPRCGSSEP